MAVKRKSKGFGEWYKNLASKNDLDPNPKDPRHFYKYKQAYKAGADSDEEGHLPSKFKKKGHPNRFVDGEDTKRGKPATKKAVAKNDKAYKKVYKKLSKGK